MQGQLETCNLEECDFFQVKLEEYPSTDSYLEDVLMEGDTIKQGYSQTGYPKGLVLAFKSIGDDGQPRFTYEYSPFAQTMTSILKWKDLIMSAHPDTSYDECIDHWYRIERYECTLVLRNRTWWASVMPKIIDFWEDVEHYRTIGNSSLIEKRDARKNKRKIKISNKSKKGSSPTNYTHVVQVNKAIVEEIQGSYLLDSDDDS